MNVCHRNKIIWQLPTETADRVTSEILKSHSFEFIISKEERQNYPKFHKYSNDDYVPKEYSDYQIFCNVRNPYDRVFRIFLNLDIGKEKLIRITNLQILKDNFLIWISKIFIGKKLVVDLDTNGKKNIVMYGLQTFLFKDDTPKVYIRYENYVNEMLNLDFIDYSTFTQTINYLNEEFDNTLDFRDFYDFESARKIYNYFFNQFHLLDYDPFSFTKDPLSDELKINFLHNTF